MAILMLIHLLFYALASNAAVLNDRAIKQTEYTANFDNLTPPTAPELSFSVGPYQGLLYNAFSLVSSSPGTAGVVPNTPPNVIATTTVDAQLIGGTPTITVNHTNSKSLAFNLESFYFGCVIPAGQGVASTAEQCSILVSGFNAANKEIAVATYTFTPVATNLLSAPMVQAVLPGTFVGLYNVTIVQSSPTTQVLYVDTVNYRLYTSS